MVNVLFYKAVDNITRLSTMSVLSLLHLSGSQIDCLLVRADSRK